MKDGAVSHLAPDGTSNAPLQTRQVALNGVALQLAGPNCTDLSPLQPKVVTAASPIVLGALTFGFIELPGAGAAACGAP